MPQMSPMNWLILFMYFNMSLYMCMLKLYYMSNLEMETSSLELKLAENNFLFSI